MFGSKEAGEKLFQATRYKQQPSQIPFSAVNACATIGKQVAGEAWNDTFFRREFLRACVPVLTVARVNKDKPIGGKLRETIPAAVQIIINSEE